MRLRLVVIRGACGGEGERGGGRKEERKGEGERERKEEKKERKGRGRLVNKGPRIDYLHTHRYRT